MESLKLQNVSLLAVKLTRVALQGVVLNSKKNTPPPTTRGYYMTSNGKYYKTSDNKYYALK